VLRHTRDEVVVFDVDAGLVWVRDERRIAFLVRKIVWLLNGDRRIIVTLFTHTEKDGVSIEFCLGRQQPRGELTECG